MQVSDAFIAHGLERARYVLFNVRNLTDMVRVPVSFRRGTAQRAKLKILGTIVRRLLWLIALGLTLAPVRPRAACARRRGRDAILPLRACLPP